MKENEIRPQDLFNELLKLTKEDVEFFFSKSLYQKINCPACGNKGKFLFNKNEFNIEECSKCKTIFVNPIPDRNSLNNYYTNSKSTKFWATTFYKKTEKNRREKIWKPKAKLINDLINKYNLNAEYIIDIGGGYGVFIEEFLKVNNMKHLIIEPSPELSNICKNKKLNVIQKFLEDIEKKDLQKGQKLFVSFELFEHLLEPKLFLKILYNLMDKNDIFVFTTLSGIGVDIQVLQKNSKAINPPMHLNFFNPKSIKILLEKIGFKIIQITTPGKLDLDILNNNKDKIDDKFWKNFLEYTSDEEKEKMQGFISNNNLSSHMMIVCQKV